MIDRRRMLLGLGALGMGSAAYAVDAKRIVPDYYELFLDVIGVWRRHDIDAVLAHMSDEIIWYAQVGATPVVGKAAVRKLLETLAPTRTGERWRIFNHAVNGRQLFVEGVDDFDDQSGHRIAIPYMGIIEFRERLIIGWRDYFDDGLLNKMMGGGPVPAEIEPLVSRSGRP